MLPATDAQRVCVRVGWTGARRRKRHAILSAFAVWRATSAARALVTAPHPNTASGEPLNTPTHTPPSSQPTHRTEQMAPAAAASGPSFDAERIKLYEGKMTPAVVLIAIVAASGGLLFGAPPRGGCLGGRRAGGLECGALLSARALSPADRLGSSSSARRGKQGRAQNDAPPSHQTTL